MDDEGHTQNNFIFPLFAQFISEKKKVDFMEYQYQKKPTENNQTTNDGTILTNVVTLNGSHKPNSKLTTVAANMLNEVSASALAASNEEDIIMRASRTIPTTSSNIQQAAALNGGSQRSSIDDGFHCHNRDEDGTKITSESSKRATRVLWLSVGVCLIFMILEVIGGILAQSLAIITDAAHLLTDLASMLISLFSIYLANRPASQRMSFGWYRAEVVGAFISVFLIWVVTGILVYLAIDRMITAHYDINATIMSITAGIGVGVNLIMGLLLYCGGHSHSHSHGLNSDVDNYHGLRQSNAHQEHTNGYTVLYVEDGEQQPLVQSNAASSDSDDGNHKETNINVRAAFIHVVGDLIQSVGVLLAGLLIMWKPGWDIIDPICTLLFSVIVLSTTIYIVRDALVVLLEGRPSSIDFRLVFNSLETIEGVKKVHDLRIWALTMNKIAISVHLEIDPSADSQAILRATTRMLRRDFNVHESTIQIEGYQPEMENCHQCVVPSK